MTGPNDPAGAPVRQREITPRVIALGLLLSVVMGAANVYVGLYAGMTVSASIPAAVMAMLVFRFLFRESSILESNQVQTCASAGESLAAGIIFTVPALVFVGFWSDFDYWTVTAIAFTGGLLGILFMIPMRKVFIEGNEELPYPEGVACAAVLEAGEEGGEEGGADADAARGLLFGGLLGGAFKLLAAFIGLFRETLETATTAGGRIFYYGADASPMLVAVGFIVRLNVAVLIAVGGALGWLVVMPLLGGGSALDGSALDAAWDLWSTQVRYVGVGAMVVGGVASIVSVRAGLLEAIRTLMAGVRGLSGGNAEAPVRTSEDIPGKAILVLIVIAVLLLAAVYVNFTGRVDIAVLATVAMLIASFFFTAVASYIVGLVGNSNSPVSGMTITAVLFAGGLIWLAGFKGPDAVAATLGVAAVVCCVACTSGDVCNDLKTGSIVGALPRRQQTMQILGVAVASLTMAPVLILLHKGVEGGIGGTTLSAPQAGLFASLARGFAGEAELPWNLIGYGALLGVAILIIDGILKSAGSRFRAHLMPIAVGMYLPFGLATPILLGGVLAHLWTRGVPEGEATERAVHRGVLFSSGVIAGEALMAVGAAAFAVAGWRNLQEVLVKRGSLAADAELFGSSATFWGTAVGCAIAVVLFAAFTRPRGSDSRD